MTIKSYFSIVEIVGWPSHVTRRDFKYRIVETNFTIDGPRTRICDGQYKTLEDAQNAVKVYESH